MQHADIVTAIRDSVRPHHRLIVAIAGPPASGKSTLAGSLAAALGPSATVVQMDGFHLDNRILKDRGLMDCKGSPESFDTAGFTNLLSRLKFEQNVIAPVFDRNLDAAIAGATVIEPHHQITLVEGNYLLLDQPPWDALAPFWDVTLWVDVPLDVLESRLVERWIEYGHSPDEAHRRALGNDIPNAHTVISGSQTAQYVIDNA